MYVAGTVSCSRIYLLHSLKSLGTQAVYYFLIFIYLFIFGLHLDLSLPRTDSLTVGHRLSSCSMWALQLLCGTWDLSSLASDQTHVPCLAWRVLNHQTTREDPGAVYYYCGITHEKEGLHLNEIIKIMSEHIKQNEKSITNISLLTHFQIICIYMVIGLFLKHCNRKMRGIKLKCTSLQQWLNKL